MLRIAVRRLQACSLSVRTAAAAAVCRRSCPLLPTSFLLPTLQVTQLHHHRLPGRYPCASGQPACRPSGHRRCRKPRLMT